MRTIELTQGKVALVDDEDYERINAKNWHAKAHHSGKVWYAIATVNEGDGRFTKRYMHKEVMNTSNLIDHRNHDGLDNQKRNLRIATNQQNTANQRGRNALSGYKGVHLHSSGKFQAQCKRKYLGLFDIAEDAAKAYDAQALINDGEFAYLNFPLHEKVGD